MFISVCSETSKFHFQYVGGGLVLAPFRRIIAGMDTHKNGSNLVLDEKETNLLVTDGPTVPLWQSFP